MYSPGMMGGDINQALQSLRQAQGAKLPPRLQRAVAGGMDPAAAQARFARFQAGQLPGQAGGMGQMGQSLGTPTADPSMNPGGIGGGMELQSFPMPQGPQGGGAMTPAYGPQAGAPPMGGAAQNVAAAMRQRNPAGSAGAVDPARAAAQAARGFQALNAKPMPGRGGMESQTEVLNGPGLNERPMPGGFQGVSQNLDQLDGGAMNAKPLFGAQGIPQGGPPARRLQGIRQGLGAAVRGAINR